MVPFSMRHPSPGCREDQTEPPQRPLCPAWHGTDNAAALRAGRPDDSPAGVLGRRSPARNAGRAVQLGWPIAVGEAPCPGRWTGRPPRASLNNLCRRAFERPLVGPGQTAKGGRARTGPGDARDFDQGNRRPRRLIAGRRFSMTDGTRKAAETIPKAR
jgi:hypothetical protein